MYFLAGGKGIFPLIFLLPTFSVSGSLFKVYAYKYYICLFYITDDGVGPEILKMVLFMGLGGSSFGLTNIYIYKYI